MADGSAPDCHCGKDGHALGSVNCPVHGVPICGSCGRRHWFLDACGEDAAVVGPADGVKLKLDPPPTVGEIEKAVRRYRAHLKRERDRQRAKRSPAG